jgi:predicted secreted protein
MKSKLICVLIIFIAFTICNSSCKKADNNTDRQVVQFDYSENGKTITAAQGQTLTLTLGNPGDGGYAFDTPQYNAMVLSLINHTRRAPTSNAIGDFGKETWEFKALKTGISVLNVTATRSFDKNNPVVMFSGTITVN